MDNSLYARIGGDDMLRRVHKRFYDKIYAHPWLKLYFADKPQAVQESQQTDFMVAAMGGPKRYMGKTPKSAHQHMVITEELFELRQSLLETAIREEGLSEPLTQEWLAVDASIKMAIVKDSAEACQRTYATQQILDFKNPEK